MVITSVIANDNVILARTFLDKLKGNFLCHYFNRLYTEKCELIIDGYWWTIETIAGN